MNGKVKIIYFIFPFVIFIKCFLKIFLTFSSAIISLFLLAMIVNLLGLLETISMASEVSQDKTLQYLSRKLFLQFPFQLRTLIKSLKFPFGLKSFPYLSVFFNFRVFVFDFNSCKQVEFVDISQIMFHKYLLDFSATYFFELFFHLS